MDVAEEPPLIHKDDWPTKRSRQRVEVSSGKVARILPIRDCRCVRQVQKFIDESQAILWNIIVWDTNAVGIIDALSALQNGALEQALGQGRHR